MKLMLIETDQLIITKLENRLMFWWLFHKDHWPFFEERKWTCCLSMIISLNDGF